MSFPVPPPALPTFGTHIDSCGGFRNDYGHSTGYSVNSCGSIQNSYGQGTGYSVDSYGTISREGIWGNRIEVGSLARNSHYGW